MQFGGNNVYLIIYILITFLHLFKILGDEQIAFVNEIIQIHKN